MLRTPAAVFFTHAWFSPLSKWLPDNGTALGVVIAAIPIMWVVQHVRVRRAEDRRILFKTFHSLIKHLVEQEHPNQAIRLDRQMAVVFGLRARPFKRYYPVTLRILEGLRNDWSDLPDSKANGKRLLDEIEACDRRFEEKDLINRWNDPGLTSRHSVSLARLK